MQDWLRGRADTRLGRLALQWFRAYFAASRNSGCAVTVYSTLSVLPAALVAVALFHSSGSDTNAFVADLISHLKLTGSTASLVQDTFGSASANKLAASITVVVSALLWGIGIGQIYQDVYARAWGMIKVGSAADQALFVIFFFVFTGSDRVRRRRRRRASRCRLARPPARLASGVDGLLALGAALPPAPNDRFARPAPRGTARDRRPRRRNRHHAFLPASDR